MRTIVSDFVLCGISAALLAIGVVSCEKTPSPKERIEISPEMYELDFGAVERNTVAFAVSGPESWEVETHSDWVVVDRTETGFVVSCKVNIDFADRGADTIIISATNADPVKIAVSQKALQVYVSGNNGDLASYLHNGDEHIINEASGMYPNGMYVTKSGDVHIVGRQGFGSYFNGFYWSSVSGWKEIYGSLDVENSINVSGVCVDESNGDVYWAAYEGWTEYTEDGYYQTWVAEYFRNESERFSITDTGVAQTSDIIIDNGDLYVLLGGDYAGYAVNGEITKLESAGDGIYTSCMQVREGDVYVGGFYLTSSGGTLIYAPCYWVNGKITAIPATVSSQVSSIYVDDHGDVWLGGTEGLGFERAAAYWYNGEKTLLTEVNNGGVAGIIAQDGRFLAVGFEEGQTGKVVMKYWLDDQVVELTDGQSDWYPVEVCFR